jgi:GT2 family glycosyltransferase
MSQNAASRVTVVMVPRERFSLQVQVMNWLRERSPEALRVIVFDAGSSRKIGRQTRESAKALDMEVVRFDKILSGNDCRNLAREMIRTDYVVFIDNDLEVKPGWLEPLVECLDETKAWAVMPLYLETNKGRRFFHAAGTMVWGEEFEGRTIYAQKLILAGEPATDEGVAALQRMEVDALEYHLFAMRMDKWEQIGPFDPDILSSHDHVDFSLCLLAAGGKIFMEPRSVVTYDKDEPLALGDLPYYLLRWSRIWVVPSLKRFAAKWGISYEREPEKWYYSVRHQYAAGWCPWLRLKPKSLLWKWIFSHWDSFFLGWVERMFWKPSEDFRREVFSKACPGGYPRRLEDKCLDFGKKKFLPHSEMPPMAA